MKLKLFPKLPTTDRVVSQLQDYLQTFVNQLNSLINQVEPNTVVISDENNLLASSSVTPDELAEIVENYPTRGILKQLVTVEQSDSPFSYTPGEDVRQIKVTVVGAGGGGGGCGGTGVGIGAAGAGGSGAVSIKWLNVEDLSSPTTVTVGSGGAGGAAGNNDGSAGGTSSFGSHCSATGGSGGAGSVGDSTTHNSAGGAGGIATDGDINLSGGIGVYGRTTSTPLVLSVAGSTGNSIIPPNASGFSSASGVTPNSPGGGGGGGKRLSSGAANQEGADGSDGLVWIEEYY